MTLLFNDTDFALQKINAKNAFGLHLIDYMQDLIKTVKEGDMTNFQVRSITVEPRFNKPVCKEVLGITNNILQPGQSYSKMYGTESRYNEPRYNEILDITSTIEDPNCKIYRDITNKCYHSTKDECKTDQQ